MSVSVTNGLDLWSLILHASVVVQVIMALLLIASVVSWTMIFNRWYVLKAAFAEAKRFEDKFWSGANLTQMNADLSRKETPTGMASIFVAGFREYVRLEKQKSAAPVEMLESVQRAMRIALTRETDALEHNLAFLATVGSTSPYVGLFGTVWGIMNSFRTLGAVQQATIAHVAPGIAEALVATAMGLFAAIPAVIAYNRYSNDVERLVTRYEIFVEEFASILQRQSFMAKHAAANA